MDDKIKFTFNDAWQKQFGKEIKEAKIGYNRSQIEYHGAQWAQDYQFRKLPSLKFRWVQKLIAIRDNVVKTRKDLLRITDPDKVDVKNWGNTIFAYLSIAGFMEKKDGRYVLTKFGNAVVDYAEEHG